MRLGKDTKSVEAMAVAPFVGPLSSPAATPLLA